MTKTKILILGSSGIVGRVIYKYFYLKHPETTFGTVRKFPSKNKLIFNYNGSVDEVKELLSKVKDIDLVINCIGKLRDKKTKEYKINYTLPNHLERLIPVYEFQLIHISTDDVFSPLVGTVNEDSIPKPYNLYGKSKLKGETKSSNAISIRTSFIGFDPNEKKGLIEFIKKNKEINGYTDQTWSGCTPLQFAILCEFLSRNNNFENIRSKTNIVHFTPLGQIIKYELLLVISKKLKLKTKINPFKSNEVLKRNLISKFFDKKFLKKYKTDLNFALDELIKFEGL